MKVYGIFLYILNGVGKSGIFTTIFLVNNNIVANDMSGIVTFSIDDLNIH